MSEPDISSIIAGLTDDDFAKLNDMAQQLFGSTPQPGEAQNGGGEQHGGGQHGGDTSGSPLGGIDPEILAKIMQIMPMLQGREDDERTRLILALKPLLSEQKQKRADEALHLMRLMEMLPMLGGMGLFNQ